MGSILFEKDGQSGAAFRVWAPNADKVFVTGDFNDIDWKKDRYPLEKEDNGYWYTEVVGAQAGNLYNYVIINGDQELIKRDPYGRKLSHDHKTTVIFDTSYDWQSNDYQTPARNELVMYEMHVGTFNDPNRNDDNPATFEDNIKKLNYLQDLGINAIALMPVMSFPGDYSWGYNMTDIFTVANRYGGPEQLKKFVDECHKRDIMVICDDVYNHVGPEDVNLWQFDGWSENDKGGIYFYQDDRGGTPWGSTRFDYGRGEVRQYIRDNFMMWLDEYKFDGARLDGTAFIRNTDHLTGGIEIGDGWTLMQWLNEEKNAKFPWKLTIAEDLAEEPWLVKTVGEGGAGFDCQWDAKFVNIIRRNIIAPDDEQRNMNEVREAIENRYNMDAFQRIIYTESHDDVANGKSRITYEIDQNDGEDKSFFAKKRSILGAGLVMTCPGIPMLFQGQEMLEERWFDDKDPVDWHLSKKFGGIVQAYRDLIRLRRNWFDTTRGLRDQNLDIFHINDTDKVIAFHRWKEGGPRDSVLVVVNFSNRSYENYFIGCPREGMWKIRFNSSWKGYDPYIDEQPAYDTEAMESFVDNKNLGINVGLGEYAVVILSQDE